MFCYILKIHLRCEYHEFLTCTVCYLSYITKYDVRPFDYMINNSDSNTTEQQNK